MGDVYLWTSKVTTGDNPANPADLAVAKKHLESVANNYGLKMLSNFADVFDATNKGNSEVIFAIRYAEGEATNGVGNFTYVVQGEVDKKGYRADGTSWNDPLRLNRNGMQWYEYIPELYQLFDEKDERRDATFITSYQNWFFGVLMYVRIWVFSMRKATAFIAVTNISTACLEFICHWPKSPIWKATTPGLKNT